MAWTRITKNSLPRVTKPEVSWPSYRSATGSPGGSSSTISPETRKTIPPSRTSVVPEEVRLLQVYGLRLSVRTLEIANTPTVCYRTSRPLRITGVPATRSASVPPVVASLSSSSRSSRVSVLRSSI